VNDRALIGKKIEKKEKNSSEPLAPATNPVVPKRKMGDLSFFFKKEESISPPTI
jgi:hypothetical protein